MNSETTISRMRSTRSRTSNYQGKSTAVRQTLLDLVTTQVQISGVLRATGVSIMPTTVFAFIRIARVQIDEKTELTVVSTDPSDVMAANACGQSVPSSEQQIEILSF